MPVLLMIELSLVMPAYNEQACIEQVVRSWLAELAPRLRSLELIVVDDGSRDSTGAVLDRLASRESTLRVIHQANAGHGAALRRALEVAQGQWIFHVDSDDQFAPGDFWKLWEIREGYDYLCGRRVGRQDPCHRRVISRLLELLVRLWFGVRLADANSPFKLIRRPALEQLLELVPRTVFAPSIMMSVAARRRWRFAEIPVAHFARRTGRISIVRLGLLRACWRCVGELRAFRAVLP